MLPILCSQLWDRGACTALEDAFVIAKCIKEQSDIVAAFQEYESLRFPRTKLIVEQSLRSGKMGELNNSFGVALRNSFMKLMRTPISNSFISLQAYRA